MKKGKLIDKKFYAIKCSDETFSYGKYDADHQYFRMIQGWYCPVTPNNMSIYAIEWVEKDPKEFFTGGLTRERAVFISLRSMV